MKPCLIVYYSRTGVTATVAKALAEACGADTERLQDLRPRTGVAAYLRSCWEALRGKSAAIAAPRLRAADYPLVVLGTPVWAGHVSAPMRAYLMQQREHFGDIAMFCTQGGNGGQNVLDEMADICHKFPVATLCLRQQDVLTGNDASEIGEFVGALAHLTSPVSHLPSRYATTGET